MSALPALVVVFALIGLLELIDRTNFALIGLAARQRRLPTWAGAAMAFLVTSAIAVLLGSVFLVFLAPDLRYVQIGGGVLILGYAAYLALRGEEDERPADPRSAFASAFLLIVLLEMGDSTMILLVLFTGSLADPLGVFAAGSVALLSVAAFACTAGGALARRVRPSVLDRTVVVILAIVGSLTLLTALVPGLLPPLLR